MSNRQWEEGANTGLIIGLVFGIIATIIIYEWIILSNNDYKIEECEKSLPRDKHCVLTAIEVTTE